MANIAFISDLHLMPQASDAGQLFDKFAREVAAGADQLYILGDFLEVWWGDDAPNDGYQPLADTLHWLATDADTEIFVMHGNRDFMIGQQLAERWHFKLLGDYETIDLNGTSAMLMHGDTLCIDDVEYQKFRAMVRDPAWQAQVMQLSIEERFKLAMQIRENSKQNASNRAEDIVDVNAGEVERMFNENDIDVIIHGHTHRPEIHELEFNGKQHKRIVLGDWHDSARYLYVADQQQDFELSSISL